MKIIFMSPAWDDYLYWQATDKSVLKKINALIKEAERTPYEGNGKPETLKHSLAGWQSRRINLEHRLIYKVENNAVFILQCRYQY
jgi:toxin YoeB